MMPLTSRERVLSAIEHEGPDRVRIIIGGTPINNAFAAEVGADGYALDASSVVRVTKALLA